MKEIRKEEIGKEEIRKEEIVIRDAIREDFGEILRMNEESVNFLAPMDMKKLERLDKEAAFHKVILVKGELAAFCLAFREGAEYESVNYGWFAAHYDTFLYVDRVVVDIKMQGKGLGKLMYDEVFRYGRENNTKRITAEINVVPENPVSLKFHAKYGFKEVGRQEICDGTKMVSLEAAELG